MMIMRSITTKVIVHTILIIFVYFYRTISLDVHYSCKTPAETFVFPPKLIPSQFEFGNFIQPGQFYLLQHF